MLDQDGEMIGAVGPANEALRGGLQAFQAAA
jgi:hypothetical protein